MNPRFSNDCSFSRSFGIIYFAPFFRLLGFLCELVGKTVSPEDLFISLRRGRLKKVTSFSIPQKTSGMGLQQKGCFVMCKLCRLVLLIRKRIEVYKKKTNLSCIDTINQSTTSSLRVFFFYCSCSASQM